MKIVSAKIIKQLESGINRSNPLGREAYSYIATVVVQTATGRYDAPVKHIGIAGRDTPHDAAVEAFDRAIAPLVAELRASLDVHVRVDF